MQFPGKPGAATPSDPQNTNLNELIKLLGPQSVVPGGAPAGAPVAAPAAAPVAQPRAAPATAAAQQQARAAKAVAAAQGRPQLTPANAAQYQLMQRRQLAQQQRQLAQQQRTSSITDELQAMLRQPKPAGSAVAPARPMYAAPTAVANAAAANVAAARAGAPGAARPTAAPGARANVTQEQVIVGHFCRHALASLTRLTSDMPNSMEMQTHLKMSIKRLWAQWVADRIAKSALLETVARIVRSSCPAAANVNVISEFRTWYHQQLTAQREQTRVRRNHVTASAAAARAAVPTNAPAPQQTQPATSTVTAANATPTQSTPQTYAYPGAPRNTAAVAAMQPGHAIGSTTMATTAPVHPSAPHRRPPPKTHAAKTIPQKTIAASTVQRAPPKQQPQLVGHMTQRKPQPAKPRPPPVQRPKSIPSKVKAEPVMPAAVHPVKREPVDLAVGSTVAAAKKPKPPPKKASPKSKKPVMTTAPATGATTVAARARPPPPRINTSAPVVTHMARPGAPPPNMANARPVPAQPSPGADASKKKKGADMLDVCGNIVDIDNEQSKLVETMEYSAPGSADVDDYGTDMLLDGATLKNKIERIMRKHNFVCGVSKETMEMLSLATRERMSYVIENVSAVAAHRADSERVMWETRTHGPNVHELLEKMCDDEERSLTLQAEQRTMKWRQAQEEIAAREAAERRPDEKSNKEAAAAAEQKKKAKVALEKKRAADSSQRSALSGAISGIGKKRKKGTHKPLPFLAPLSSSLKNESAKSSGGSNPVAAPAVSGATSTPQTQGGTTGNTVAPVQAVAIRPPLMLQDCLHFMSQEHNMRQSALVYKWFARLGAPPPRRTQAPRPRR